MKKALSIVLVVFMLFSIMPLTAFANDEEMATSVSDGFEETESIDFMISDSPEIYKDEIVTDSADESLLTTGTDELDNNRKFVIPIVLAIILAGVVVIVVVKKKKK